MRGVHWDARGGLRCEDCGGYEIDMLEGGLARCRSCGRVSHPSSPGRHAGLGRLGLWMFALFAAIVAAETGVSWAYAAVSGAKFVEIFSLLSFVTGFAAIVVGGIGAYPGRVALGNQRTDRLGWANPIQDPVVMGTLSTEAKARSAGEPGAAGVFLTLGLGVALLVAGFVSVAL